MNYRYRAWITNRGKDYFRIHGDYILEQYSEDYEEWISFSGASPRMIKLLSEQTEFVTKKEVNSYIMLRELNK